MADIHDVKALIDVLDPKKTRDAVVNFYNTHSIENWSNLDKANIYTILAEFSVFTNEYSNASHYFNLATQYFNLPYEDKGISYLGEYYYHFSSLEIELGNFMNAKELAERCFEYNSQKNDKHGLAKAFDILCQVELKLLNMNKAIYFAEKCIEVYKKINGRLEIIYTNIGEIYRIKGDLNMGLEYYEKAVEIAVKNNDHYTLAINYNNLGLLYSELGAYESALNYFQKSLEKFEQLKIFDIECMIDYTECLISAYIIGDPNKNEYLLQIENNFMNLRKNLFKTRSNILLFYYFNAIGHYEIKRNNFNVAEEYYLISMNIAELSGNQYQMIVVQTHLINWALKQYNIDKNRYYLEQSQDLLERAKSIAIETMKPDLLAELRVLETLIYSYQDVTKSEKILSEILLFAQKNNDTRLINKITEVYAKIKNKMTIGSEEIDLSDFQQYFNLIAKITATHQGN